MPTQWHCLNTVQMQRTAPFSPQTIAIIGGGFSGVMVAIHLLKNAISPLTVYLIERQAHVGRGIAYGTQQSCHLLNVPANKMSAFPDEPNHFYCWLQQCGYSSFQPTDFVPRQIYGQYIQAILNDAKANASPNVLLKQITDEVLSIQKSEQNSDRQYLIQLRSGMFLSVESVVLASGNLSPNYPIVEDSSFYQSSRYIGSAWSSHALSQLDPSMPVLLIGSGLTAIDALLTLRQQGHRSTIHLVSRRGLLPQAHRSTTACQSVGEIQDITTAPPTVRALLRFIRNQVDRTIAEGGDWRTVIDALRPHTQALWQSLPPVEQKRFLRHVRPYWDVHRHRMAPRIAQHLSSLLRMGIVHCHAVRIQSFHEDETGVTIVIRDRGQHQAKIVRVQAVINCTGPNSDYSKASHPLFFELLTSGLIRPNALNLGLDVDANGALIGRDGQPSSQLYTLGSLQLGKLWETTAVPEIRQQAKVLAKHLLLHARSVASDDRSKRLQSGDRCLS